jgi:hypothetical protein
LVAGYHLLTMSDIPFVPWEPKISAAVWPRPYTWAFAIVIAVLSWIWLPLGGDDWHFFFGIAARNWWPDPWAYLGDFPYVPWTGLLLSPLGGAPDRLATAVTNALAVVVFGWGAKRLGGPEWVAILVLVSPPGFFMFRNGQMEWLTLFGVLLFNGLDLLFIIIKPQVAIGIVLPRLKRAGSNWMRYLAPVAIAGILSLLIWPGWPLRALPDPNPEWLRATWNWSVWPWGVPVALVLLWFAWRRSDDRLGLAASPLLSPYVNMPNYLGLMLVLAARWPKWAFIVWAIFWLTGLIWYFTTFR